MYFFRDRDKVVEMPSVTDTSPERGIKSRINTSFVDVSDQSGITHRHRLPASDPNFLTAETIDLCDDLELDGMIRMAVGMGGGLAVGDYNNDGYENLFFTQSDSLGILYKNNTDGSFADVTVESGISRAFLEMAMAELPVLGCALESSADTEPILRDLAPRL